MHLKILQQDLIGPLQAVSRSIGVKLSLPVLGNILLETKEGALRLSATNLEVGVIKQVKANILEDGALTVPAKTLIEVISSLPSSQIELVSSGESLDITSDKFKARLNAISASEFPAIPSSTDFPIQIPKEVFLENIPQISFASAVDEGRPVLTGILTEIKDSRFEAVATDGYRLSHKSYQSPSLQDIIFKALIPRRTLEELVKLTQEEGGEDQKVGLATTDNQNQVIFKIGNTLLSSRLIEGNFPSWEKIIPSNFLSWAKIDKDELNKSLKLASVFARGETNVIKFILNGRTLKITSQSRDLGQQDSEVEAEVEGEDMEVAFNSRYLTEAVSNCPAKIITLEFSGPLSACRITPEKDLGLEYIVMPVRVN